MWILPVTPSAGSRLRASSTQPCSAGLLSSTRRWMTSGARAGAAADASASAGFPSAGLGGCGGDSAFAAACSAPGSLRSSRPEKSTSTVSAVAAARPRRKIATRNGLRRSVWPSSSCEALAPGAGPAFGAASGVCNRCLASSFAPQRTRSSAAGGEGIGPEPNRSGAASRAEAGAPSFSAAAATAGSGSAPGRASGRGVSICACALASTDGCSTWVRAGSLSNGSSAPCCSPFCAGGGAARPSRSGGGGAVPKSADTSVTSFARTHDSIPSFHRYVRGPTWPAAVLRPSSARLMGPVCLPPIIANHTAGSRGLCNRSSGGGGGGALRAGAARPSDAAATSSPLLARTAFSKRSLSIARVLSASVSRAAELRAAGRMGPVDGLRAGCEAAMGPVEGLAPDCAAENALNE